MRGGNMKARTAFTLIELLVVVAIIGGLIALLLPAIQSARESARALTCNNKVKQLALGWHTHHSLHGHFPTGGWHGGYPTFAPDADRGFGKRQPGTWTFNVLPYIEQGAVRDLGKGKTRGNYIDSKAFRVWFSTPIPDFLCPTRGRDAVFVTEPYSNFPYMARPFNVLQRDWESMNRSQLAVTDYVANQASRSHNIEDKDYPKSYEDADSPAFAWFNSSNRHGLCYYRSAVRTTDLEDGSSNIYFVGERHIPAACHLRIVNPCAPDGYFYFDTDQFSLSYDEDKAASLAVVSSHLHDEAVEHIDPFFWQPPLEDFAHSVPGSIRGTVFGSSHPHSFHMAFCDGSVRRISYDIDPLTHIRLGYRDDGYAVDMSKLE